MYKSATSYFVKIEEELNELLRDPKIQKLRTALVEYVTELLRERVPVRMEQAGLNAEMERLFLAGETAELYSLLQDQKHVLGISQNQIREFKRNAKVNRAAAWEYLLDILLEEEKLQFRKNAGIAAKVWISFLNHTVLPGEATLEKIRTQLELTPEQMEEFNRRVIRYAFQVDQILRETVHMLWKKTGMTLTDFLNYAYIGKEAWEAFYPVKADPSQPKKTSQETLLKLVVGFDLDEPGAWNFMDTAKSAFAVRRDLVVLSCIRCACTDPMLVQEILEFFAEGRNGERYYKNPYC